MEKPLILSTPLTVCLLVVGRYIPQLSILETLLGSSPALSRQTRIYQRLIANDPDDAIDIAEDVIEDHRADPAVDVPARPLVRGAEGEFRPHRSVVLMVHQVNDNVLYFLNHPALLVVDDLKTQRV